MEKELKEKTESRMKSAIESLKHDFSKIRTGRASLALLDGIMVDSYGSKMPINQLATLGTPDPRMITIQPWDPKVIGDIEKAIQKSDLDLTPSNDGKIVRINIPPLTEERRKQIVKTVKKRTEEAKVSIRNIRRDTNDELKKMEKEDHISEDETKRSLTDVQHMTDSYIKETDEIFNLKEKEVMEV